MPDEATPDLITRARQDPGAFGELYRLYVSRVFGFCRVYTESREEAEDLTAQTFERAFGAIQSYEVRGVPFSSWLLRIASRAIIDHARRTGRSTLLAADLATEPDHREQERWEQAFWLRTHVAALPDDQQRVIRMRFYEGRSFAQIAAAMKRSEGAVKQLLRRALQSLQKRIEDEAGEEERPDV